MEDEVVGALDSRDSLDLVHDFLGKFHVRALPHQLVQDVEKDLQSGFEDEDGDQGTDPAVDVPARKLAKQCADQRNACQDRVRQRVLSGGNEVRGVGLLSGSAGIQAEKNLGEDRHDQHDQGHGRIVCGDWMDDLLNGLHQELTAGEQYQDCDDQTGKVLHASKPERVLLRGALSHNDHRDDGHERRDAVREVVDGIRADRDGVRSPSNQKLDDSERDIDQNADDADNDDLLIPVDQLILFLFHFCHSRVPPFGSSRFSL